MSSSPEGLLYDAYAAYSQRFVDLGGLPARLGETLWIGSYFGLIAQLPQAPALLLDIDPGAVREAARRFPGTPVVQADVCRLPFHRCFDSILMAGAVSAYLLDDDRLAAAARSLATALRPDGPRRLYLDAYHRRYIQGSSQFNGRQALLLGGRRWWREARNQPCPGEPCRFEVTLDLWPEAGDEPPRRFRFRQRAFDPEELSAPFAALGLAWRDLRVDEGAGRFALVLGPRPGEGG